MMSFLTTYAVPIIGSAILAAFAKPNKDKPAIWKLIVDKITTPSTPTTTQLPSDLLSVLPSLLDQLLRKPPPANPEQPTPTIDPNSPQDLVSYILSLLSLPDSPNAPVDDVTTPTIEHHDTFASLVACADAVAKANPDCDIVVTIDKNGAKASKVKRAEPQ